MLFEEQGWRQLGNHSPSGNLAGVPYLPRVTCELSLVPERVKFQLRNRPFRAPVQSGMRALETGIRNLILNKQS